MAIFSGDPLLAALSGPDRDALLGLGTARAYPADSHLMRQGDPEKFIVAIVSGWTVVRADSANGRSVIFGLCGPMDVVGEMSAFDGGPRSASVVALVDVQARVVTEDRFRGYLRARPHVYEAVTRSMSSRLRAADEQTQDLATLPVLRRLARLLLDLDGTRPLAVAAGRLTQQELAAAIGATRESVAKALADLRARNVLQVVERRIVVLDRPALQAIAKL